MEREIDSKEGRGGERKKVYVYKKKKRCVLVTLVPIAFKWDTVES